MAKTFAYRRQEVVRDKPMIAEFKIRWPGLFTVAEVEAEFVRIRIAPLFSKFLAQLDQHSAQLIKVFKKKGGSAGRKISLNLVPIAQNETVEKKRECILRALCIYLNEDLNILFKEYLDSDATAVQRELERLIFGIYSVSVEGGDATTPPADVGIVIEGVEVLPDLGDVASACALLMGVIYALNLSYPQELKAFFEVLQKFFLQLDDCRLSTKDSDATAVQRELERLIFGIYSVSVEGGDATTPPADVGIVIEGVEVLPDLGDVASACALLMGVIYALNLSYPQELKAFFEVLQKFFLQLDDCRLSTKVQMLKNKLYESANQ
ncbi:uncharacterized protein [Trachinotus anak]|uniref:uncharacterized protein isoform X3 n=1 Tax=Trachinotus anak TaxID=443729 RepID=UPI0039F25B4F